MDWASECQKTAMWPGWVHSKWSQTVCQGGAENPLARASPGRIQPAAPLLSSRLVIGWGVLWKAESRATPPTRARGGGGQEHQARLPPGTASSAQSRTWSCSASRLRIGAPTTCSALQPRKLGGREEREEREEETELTHAFPSSTQSSPRPRPPPLFQLPPLQPLPRLPPEESHRPDPRRCPCRPFSGPGDPCTVQLSLLFLPSLLCKKRNY